MASVELNAKKMEVVEMLLDVDDEETVEKIISYISGLKRPAPPCQFTVEEMKARVEKGEMDIKAGRVIPHESIRRKHLS